MCVQPAFFATNPIGQKLLDPIREGMRAFIAPASRRRYNSVVLHFQLFRGGKGIAKASYVAYQVPKR
jgi:hypothetical protein